MGPVAPSACLALRAGCIVIDERGCWIWQFNRNPKGYGTWNGRLAHSLVYERLVGRVPAGLELDHICRVRPCVNPAHLEIVTHTENIRRGKRAKLTREKARAIYVDARPCRIIAQEYGVGVEAIYKVKSRNRWADCTENLVAKLAEEKDE